MATSSSSLSSAGIGSGLDVSSIISSLMAVERAPLDAMKTAEAKLNAQLSVYGKLQSYVSALGDAAGKLATSGTWSQTKATSSNESAVTATSSGDATAGSYSIQINALASGQTLASATQASASEAAGMSGTLRLESGVWNEDQSTFEPINYPSFVDVAISSSDSVEAIRDKINAASAGVTASIVTDSTGTRLILRSKTTGAESGFRVSVTDDDGDGTDASGLSSLAFDPSAGVTSMMQTKAASDASASVDGLVVTSKTNTFNDIIPGISFVARTTTAAGGAVDISVANDTEAMQKTVEAFVTAYNDLTTYMREQTKYDDTTKTAGTLQGDSGANALRSGLRSIGAANAGSASAFSRLADVGLDPQADGTLKLNSAKLTAALAKPDELEKLFGDADVSTSEDDGFATRIQDWTRSLLSIEGAVSTRQTSLKTRLRDNDKQQNDFEDRMTRVQDRLTAQYTALDTQMSKMTSLQNYVTQQIANWNKSSG